MFFGNNIPISIFAGQNINLFGDDPTLYRNFIIDPQLNGPENILSRIGPDLNFRRPTIGSYWNSLSAIEYASENNPRFNYNNGNFLGLLIEEPRANLITYSEDFTNPVWFKSTTTIPFDDELYPGVSVTPDIIEAPDGTNTGTLITQSGGLGWHSVSWSFGTPLDNNFYSRSIYIKKETARYVAIISALTPFQTQVTRVFDFNLPGFVGGFLVPTPVGTIFEDVGNGWYKITVNRSSTNNNTNKIGIAIINSPETANTQYTPGATLSGVYVWGAQVERGSFSTSYIPTNGTSLIRAGDQVDITQTPFRKTYNKKEGTYYTKGSKIVLQNGPPITIATVTGPSNLQYWTLNSNSFLTNVNNITATGFITNLSSLSANVLFDVAVGLKRDDCVIFKNQELVTTIDTILLPTQVNTFQIGNYFNNDFFNGNLQIFGYWPKRFSNSIIESLTGQSEAV